MRVACSADASGLLGATDEISDHPNTLGRRGRLGRECRRQSKARWVGRVLGRYAIVLRARGNLLRATAKTCNLMGRCLDHL
jgi:hypothetical protein